MSIGTGEHQGRQVFVQPHMNLFGAGLVRHVRGRLDAGLIYVVP